METSVSEITYLERLEIIATEEDFALAEALIGQALAYGWEEESLPTGDTKLTMHSEDAATLDDLAQEIKAYLPLIDCQRSRIEQHDWTTTWKKHFTPVLAEDFLIVPPWLAQSEENPAHKHMIIIEPKSAFGTGHHASTVLCLKAISTLHDEGKIKKNQEFLDLGTGTGILGIACTKYGLTGYGLDIETLAVSNAIENNELNGVSNAQFPVELGSIDKAQKKQYDVVIANILAAPLREMAQEIMECVKPNGCLILSGFLTVQCPDLEKSYKKMGVARRFSQETDMKDSEWISLFWDK